MCFRQEAARKEAPPGAPAPAGLEVAEIFRRFSDELPVLAPEQARAVRDIVDCRTPALGGHLHQCDRCGHTKTMYNSCLNRHCPKCQSLSQARWLEARQKDLLPAQYFHLLFTIPDSLHPLFRANPRACHNLLFAAASETLQEVALNPARLGAQVGFIAVLHTWTQTLLYHPHLHCIAPGGGLDRENGKWLPCRPEFFLPVRVLSAVFRGKLLSKLEQALDKGELRLPNSSALLRKSARTPWVVYCKPPFAGPDQVLRYLGRYTHRIAISNHRLVSLDGRQVTFRFRDRAHGNKRKLATIDALEFLRRFLSHVLPRGFMRIRHYGFLANAVRRKSIALCRSLLADQGQSDDPLARDNPAPETWQQLHKRLTGVDATLCPACKRGRLIVKETIYPCRWSLPGRAFSP